MSDVKERQLNVRVDEATFQLFDSFAASRGMTKGQALAEALEAVKREDFVKNNPDWAKTERAVRSHLNAVADAFKQLAENGVEIERGVRDEFNKRLNAKIERNEQLEKQLEEARRGFDAEKTKAFQLQQQVEELQAKLDEAEARAVEAEGKVAGLGDKIDQLIAKLG